MTVIRHWFAVLHSALDELIGRYLHASEKEKDELKGEWTRLKALSDEVLEHWLKLEDKLASFLEMAEQEAHTAVPAPPVPELQLADFRKGQGYFKLQMYPQAAEHLEKTVRAQPDLLSARLYLGMSRMHLKEWGEAQHEFRVIAALAEDARLKAVALNALGCIHAVQEEMDEARQCFLDALEADPTYDDPRENLALCQKGGATLKLQFGSAQLYAML